MALSRDLAAEGARSRPPQEQSRTAADTRPGAGEKKAPLKRRDTAKGPMQQKPPPDDTKTKKKKEEVLRKQSQAFTNANAIQMFQAFQKLGNGGHGSLDIKDFIALCGGENTADVRQLFAMLDEDMSGTLDIGEISHAIRHNKQAAEKAEHYTGLHDLCHLARGRKKRGHVHHKHEIRSIAQFQAFAKLDNDGNGTLDEQEFVSVCVGDDAGANVEEAKKLFAMLDEDHSGTVNCGELGHALKHNKEAEKLAKHYAALHDLVHMAHGRKHHKPDSHHGHGHGHSSSHHHGHSHKHRHGKGAKDEAAARRAAFSKLDANGDGSLDFDEFLSVCGGDAPEKVRELFDLLDLDLSGSLEVEEIERSLASDPEAADLARNFTPLHDLIELSMARKHGSHHHHHSHRHHHKQRHADVLEAKKVALVTELYGTGEVARDLIKNITPADPNLQALLKQSGTKGDKARELVKVLQEEEEHEKAHARRKLSRRNSTRGGHGGPGGKHGKSRRRSKLARRNTNGRPGASQARKTQASSSAAAAASLSASTRRKSSKRLLNMMQAAELRQGQRQRVAKQRWRSTRSRMKIMSSLSRRPSAASPSLTGRGTMRTARGPHGGGL